MGLVKFKAGITLEDLQVKVKEKTDLQAAQEMQKAKAKRAQKSCAPRVPQGPGGA